MSRRLTVDQRGRVAEKIMELGNLIFLGLVITQAISGTQFNLKIGSIGTTTLVLSYLLAYFIIRGGGK